MNKNLDSVTVAASYPGTGLPVGGFGLWSDHTAVRHSAPMGHLGRMGHLSLVDGSRNANSMLGRSAGVVTFAAQLESAPVVAIDTRPVTPAAAKQASPPRGVPH